MELFNWIRDHKLLSFFIFISIILSFFTILGIAGIIIGIAISLTRKKEKKEKEYVLERVGMPKLAKLMPEGSVSPASYMMYEMLEKMSNTPDSPASIERSGRSFGGKYDEELHKDTEEFLDKLKDSYTKLIKNYSQVHAGLINNSNKFDKKVKDHVDNNLYIHNHYKYDELRDSFNQEFDYYDSMIKNYNSKLKYIEEMREILDKEETDEFLMIKEYFVEGYIFNYGLICDIDDYDLEESISVLNRIRVTTKLDILDLINNQGGEDPNLYDLYNLRLYLYNIKFRVLNKKVEVKICKQLEDLIPRWKEASSKIIKEKEEEIEIEEKEREYSGPYNEELHNDTEEFLDEIKNDISQLLKYLRRNISKVINDSNKFDNKVEKHSTNPLYIHDQEEYDNARFRLNVIVNHINSNYESYSEKIKQIEDYKKILNKKENIGFIEIKYNIKSDFLLFERSCDDIDHLQNLINDNKRWISKKEKEIEDLIIYQGGEDPNLIEIYDKKMLLHNHTNSLLINKWLLYFCNKLNNIQDRWSKVLLSEEEKLEVEEEYSGRSFGGPYNEELHDDTEEFLDEVKDDTDKLIDDHSTLYANLEKNNKKFVKKANQHHHQNLHLGNHFKYNGVLRRFEETSSNYNNDHQNNKKVFEYIDEMREILKKKESKGFMKINEYLEGNFPCDINDLHRKITNNIIDIGTSDEDIDYLITNHGGEDPNLAEVYHLKMSLYGDKRNKLVNEWKLKICNKLEDFIPRWEEVKSKEEEEKEEKKEEKKELIAVLLAEMKDKIRINKEFSDGADVHANILIQKFDGLVYKHLKDKINTPNHIYFTKTTRILKEKYREIQRIGKKYENILQRMRAILRDIEYGTLIKSEDLHNSIKDLIIWSIDDIDEINDIDEIIHIFNNKLKSEKEISNYYKKNRNNLYEDLNKAFRNELSLVVNQFKLDTLTWYYPIYSMYNDISLKDKEIIKEE